MKLKSIIATVAMSASSLFAADVYWTGNGDGATWNNAVNWNPQQVPTAADTAIFEKAATLADTVNVLGRMTVRNGAAVTATETVLGGTAGCSANLLVTGSGSSFKSDKVTVGCADGGSGKMVTENGGSVFIDTVNKDGLVIASGAVPAEGDVIDVLEVGDDKSRVAYFENKSSYKARVRFMSATSTLSLRTSGYTTYQKPFKSGNWVFAADAPAAVNIYVCQMSHFTDSHILTVEGTGAFNVTLGGSQAPYNCRLKLLNKGGFSWAKGAPVNFTKAKVDMQEMLGQLTVANALNVNGNAVFADGLTVASTGSLTATADDSFTFGTSDRDGVLSADIPVEAPVTKVGAGTLTVTGASSAGRFALSGGTLKVTAATSLVSLTMETGTTLIVDGADLVLGNLEQHGSVTVTTVNGGRILYGGEEQSDIVRPALGGEFVKVGSGKMTMYEPVAYPSALHVTEGELVFSKYGMAQRYWRWTFKEPSGSDPSALNCLGQMWLFAPDGSRVAKNSMSNAGSSPNIDLSSADSYKGKISWRCDPDTTITGSANSWEHPYNLLGSLFQSSARANNNFPLLTAPLIDKNDPKTYLGLEFRLKDAEAAVTGYNIGVTTRGKGRPRGWTVEASDDGKSWEVVDERSNVALPLEDYAIFYDGTVYNRKDGFADDFHPAETFRFKGYLSKGLVPLATPLSVQVDEDAKLNLKAFTGGQSIGALTYDAALGAGEIENAVFAANGTLYYTSASGKPARGTVLPYLLTNCSGLENLKTWSVVINGKATAWRVSVQNGQLTLISPGLFIVVQ